MSTLAIWSRDVQFRVFSRPDRVTLQAEHIPQFVVVRLASFVFYFIFILSLNNHLDPFYRDRFYLGPFLPGPFFPYHFYRDRFYSDRFYRLPKNCLFFLPLYYSAPSLPMFSLEFCGEVNREETRVVGLSSSENRLIVAGVVLAWYQRVTDGQTDGQNLS